MATTVLACTHRAAGDEPKAPFDSGWTLGESSLGAHVLVFQGTCPLCLELALVWGRQERVAGRSPSFQVRGLPIRERFRLAALNGAFTGFPLSQSAHGAREALFADDEQVLVAKRRLRAEAFRLRGFVGICYNQMWR